MDREREEEFQKVKELIAENYEVANCGFHNSISGDAMETIYSGKYFTLDICYDGSYFSIFGATDNEFLSLEKIYRREEEFEGLKGNIEYWYDDARCGLFNSRNVVWDKMHNIFRGEYFVLDISWDWEYFEVFGTNNEEFQELERFYKSLRK